MLHTLLKITPFNPTTKILYGAYTNKPQTHRVPYPIQGSTLAMEELQDMDGEGILCSDVAKHMRLANWQLENLLEIKLVIYIIVHSFKKWKERHRV